MVTIFLVPRIFIHSMGKLYSPLKKQRERGEEKVRERERESEREKEKERCFIQPAVPCYPLLHSWQK